MNERASGRVPTDEEWAAIAANDEEANGRFLYAIRTTGIYCKPSCKSRLPNRSNVTVFDNAGQAAEAGYRSCKRCKPAGERLPDEEWVRLIAEYIDAHYVEPLQLQTIADACHGSPYHLQRTFKRLTGVTPTVYLQQARLQAAERLLQKTDWPIAEIGQEAGLPNTAYFITLFKSATGVTPAEYRKNFAAERSSNDNEVTNR
ncbi:bifunctional transcriptional activator/DNA repair enzyme AdaA [Paenibacillus sp. NPDC058071]|uniref:bifunctional transcriptional activator/DNA repair enzyme AdaA n=1 Tax=Paenibacillus sp. NPDC058071 TaxID=3346326 RepID=UPI0036DA3994